MFLIITVFILTNITSLVTIVIVTITITTVIIANTLLLLSLRKQILAVLQRY